MISQAFNHPAFRVVTLCRENLPSPKALIISGGVVAIIGTAMMCKVPAFSTIGLKTGGAVAFVGLAVAGVGAYLRTWEETFEGLQCDYRKTDIPLGTSFQDACDLLNRVGSFVYELNLHGALQDWSDEEKNAFLRRLPGSCPNLTTVDLSLCGLNDNNRASFELMLNAMDSLAALNLSENALVEREGFMATIQALANKPCPKSLKRLELCYLREIPNMDPRALKDGFERLEGLQELILDKASSGSVIENIVPHLHHLPALIHLSLSDSCKSEAHINLVRDACLKQLYLTQFCFSKEYVVYCSDDGRGLDDDHDNNDNEGDSLKSAFRLARSMERDLFHAQICVACLKESAKFDT